MRIMHCQIKIKDLNKIFIRQAQINIYEKNASIFVSITCMQHAGIEIHYAYRGREAERIVVVVFSFVVVFPLTRFVFYVFT